MKKRRLLVLSIAIILVFSTVLQVYGDSVKDLKNQQNKIQSQIENTKREIKAMQNKSKDVDNQIKELDLRVANAASEIQNVENELGIINIEIEDTLLALDEAEVYLEGKIDTFNDRLRVMYKNGNAGYLEVLLSASNIKDFLSRQEMIQSIAEYDKELIKYMKEQRDIIQENKIALEAKSCLL